MLNSGRITRQRTAMYASRRQVLTSSLLLSTGVFVGSSTAASHLANEQLQVGVIGVGNRGATNLAEIARHAQIVALCDVDEGYLAPAADRCPEAKTFRDLRELLALPNLDAVLISTPDHTHAFAALTAMKRGLHVFCEKPLTHSVDELQKLLAVAAAKKVVTQTGMQHHVREGTRRAAAILKSGMLGEVAEIHAWTDRPIWPQGIEPPTAKEAPPKTLAWDLWLGPAAERPYHEIYHPLRWRGWQRFGSGALGDFGPHLLDTVFWGLDLPAPMQIDAESSKRFAETFPVASSVRMTFEKTDQRPRIELHWYDGGRLPVKEITGSPNPPPSGVMVLGERGKLFLPDYGREPRVLGYQGQMKMPAPLETPADIYQDWVAACRTGGDTCLPFSAAAPLMQSCLLGNIALRVEEAATWNQEKSEIGPHAAERFLADDYRAGWRLP